MAHVLSVFPRVSFSFAYGSGVMKQLGYGKSQPMIDMVFAVENSTQWHAENLKLNPSHYSGLKVFGPNIIARVEDWGAHIYYNTLVEIDQQLYKYGVIETSALRRDLRDWDTLYVSGRLHKPVRILQNNSAVQEDQERNLRSALATACFFLPEHFTDVELFERIAGLSYLGDVRMRFGENRKKVSNIVAGSVDHFRQMYAPAIQGAHFLNTNPTNTTIQQNMDPAVRALLCRELPFAVTGANPNVNLVTLLSERPQEIQEAIRQQIHTITYRSSRTQTVKGVLTAGLSKSLRYGWAKVQKARHSK
eukprot:GILK01011449.1.p1 GENE.GILK01011449.1~~GILK01011449.1.p1  ORF type:complete len:317 (+),score=36.40 GILK01011449.1:37-951(+)